MEATALEGDAGEAITALIAVIQHERYALPITEITAVYQDVVIVPVPCAPEFVAGSPTCAVTFCPCWT